MAHTASHTAMIRTGFAVLRVLHPSGLPGAVEPFMMAPNNVDDSFAGVLLRFEQLCSVRRMKRDHALLRVTQFFLLVQQGSGKADLPQVVDRPPSMRSHSLPKSIPQK